MYTDKKLKKREVMKKILIFVLAAIVIISVSSYVALTVSDKNKSENQITTLADALTESVEAAFAEITEATTKKESIIDKIFQKETTAVATTAPAENKIPDYPYAYAGFEPAYANVDIDDWKMLLVNRDYILPEDYSFELAPCITDDPDSLKLDSRVAPHYNEMYLAALDDGIELTPISGYRSVERQKNNFEKKIKKYTDEGYSKIEATQMAATIILPPGTSEHNAGLAMDICSLYESFENTEEFSWLSENAADYGFILRYPEDKQDITKIIYEPWHWRYVGVEAAKEMKASGQCFEEYLGVA